MWTRRLSELTIAACIALGPVEAWAVPPAGAALDDPLADYRERFKLGMDRYQAGAFTEAIGYWEPIYRELGERKGYRLAYDLGIAYEELGDATHAAEHLQAFLSQADERRSHGETMPPLVQKEETDARARVASLTAAKGRIHVDPGSPPRAVQVDAMEPRLAAFVAWVNPGEHTVTFGPGAPDAETKPVDVRAGEIVDVSAPPPKPPPQVPGGAPSAHASPSGEVSLPAVAPAPSPPPPITRRQAVHPFPAAILYASGGLAVAAGVASVALEMHAWSLHDRDVAELPTIPASDRSDFAAARTVAYVTMGTAVGLGLVTAALATWYFAGTSQREVVVTPGGVAGRF